MTDDSRLDEVDQVAPTSTVVIPLAAESLEIGKRVVDTGRGVRVTKTVSEREELVDEPLEEDELRVERVPINQVLQPHETPVARQEGDVTVIPVLEEVVVTEIRRMLKEEVRITRVRREVHKPQRVVLRSEQVSVERFDEAGNPLAGARRDD
jgi:uncharacterized protein (TIGR02271 family)